MRVTLNINGQRRQDDVEPRMLLVHYLRDVASLTGTHVGCETSLCGACTVLMNGHAVKSCTILTVQADGAEVTTIEGVAGREADAVARTWAARDVPQCGYCQSGQVMSAIALLRRVRNPSDRDIDLAMNGNICRCATYVRIRAAIKDAATTLGG